MQSQLSSKYDELNKKMKDYRNRVVRNSLIAFGGAVILLIVPYLSPSPPPMSSPIFWPRLALGIVGVVMPFGGIILLMRDDVDLDLEQRWFLRTFGVATKLNEYIMNPSKWFSKWRAKRRLEGLTIRVERLWSLDFKLAKETLSAVETFVETLGNKILYSLEKGGHEQAREVFSFLEKFCWFLLKEHPTVGDLPVIDATNLVLLQRPVPSKSVFGKTLSWIRPQLTLQRIPARLALGLFAGYVTFLAAQNIEGVDTNYAWATAVAVFLGMPVYFALHDSLAKKKT